jgi:hypothetical protein
MTPPKDAAVTFERRFEIDLSLSDTSVSTFNGLMEIKL